MTVLLHSGLMVIEGDTHASQWVRDNGGQFGRGSDAAMEAAISVLHPGDTIVDVGCNIGGHAWFYAEAVGPEGRVIGYDPNPDCIKCARHNCPQNCTFFCLAAGERNDFSHLAVPDNAGAAYLAGEGISCATVRLDDHLKVDRLDVLKIDAEGSEHVILSGASALLCHFRPKLVIEVNRPALARFGTSPEGLLRIIMGSGYEWTMVPEGAQPSDRQYDVLCKPVIQ